MTEWRDPSKCIRTISLVTNYVPWAKKKRRREPEGAIAILPAYRRSRTDRCAADRWAIYTGEVRGFLLDLEQRRWGTWRSLLLQDGEERGTRVIWLNDPEHPLSAWLICLHGWTHNIWIIREGRRPERENYSSLRPWYVDKNNSNNWHYSSNIIWSHCENCEERRRIDNGIMHVVQSRVAKMFCWMSNANWLYV